MLSKDGVYLGEEVKTASEEPHSAFILTLYIVSRRAVTLLRLQLTIQRDSAILFHFSS